MEPLRKTRQKPFLSGAFRGQEFLANTVWNYIVESAPREACGVLGWRKNLLTWFPCRNNAKDPNQFEMDSVDFVRAQIRSDVFAIVHSHINSSCEPSSLDRSVCNILGLDYYIISWPQKELFILKPLKGRNYEWAESDCFTLASDFYAQEIGLDFPRQEFEKDAWKEGIDAFSPCAKEYGFREVLDNSLQKYDLLIFNILSDTPNHCGVYTGEGNFIHHAINSLSCEEPLHPKWGKYKSKVYRHESLFNG